MQQKKLTNRYEITGKY